MYVGSSIPIALLHSIEDATIIRSAGSSSFAFHSQPETTHGKTLKKLNKPYES